MRIAVISDIHGNLDALNAVLADIETRNVNQIVNLGDCLSGPLDGLGTADRLMALELPTVRGNHDRLLYDRPISDMDRWETWVIHSLSDEHITWLRSFRQTIKIGDVLFCHGTPDSDETMWLHKPGPEDRMVSRDLIDIAVHVAEIDAQIVCCGHTHTQTMHRIPEGPMIVNAGSVGCPGFSDTRKTPPFIHQTGSPDARYVIIDNSTGGWRVEFHAVPYDPSRMAAMAREQGNESWALALETGWMA